MCGHVWVGKCGAVLLHVLRQEAGNQHLSPCVLQAYFADEQSKGRTLSELYELVQHAGNVLPRL